MKFVYIDEAGNTGDRADPDQPIHMIGSLIVDDKQIRDIEVKLNELAKLVLSMVDQEDLFFTHDDIEFHGADIYGGNKTFRKLNPQNRVDICQKIISCCVDSQVEFGFCAVDKIKLETKRHPHMLCFQFTIERVQDYLASAGELGLIVADEHRELEERLIAELSFSKEFKTKWGYRPTAIRNVVDTVHFVKSRHNRLMQASDVLTYFKLKGLRIRRRLLDEYMVEHPAAVGPRVDFASYITAKSKPAERAVLELYDQIGQVQIFAKVWP